MKKLGIVGHGFVGSAINQGFTKNIKKYIVDPNKYSGNTIKKLIEFQPDAVFVSVPTPQLESGECNTDILDSVLQELNTGKNLLVVIKSTVPAYKLQAIREQCINLKIVYNPEFLTEKNYLEDFRRPPMHVFGGDRSDTDRVEALYREHSVCEPCPVFHTDLITASMVKYCINSFLATKVTFMNEMYDVLKNAGGTEWSEFASIISTDPRLGTSHMRVPGNDGVRGYAGSCFPKDTAALAYYAREILNVPFTQLETSIEINERLRKLNQS
jgi:UDPglucose 6-dehydrogenase